VIMAMGTTSRSSVPLAPSINLQAAICKETASLCGKTFGNVLRSIILSGSLARDEGTFINEGDAWTALGDAEFFLIFDEAHALPGTSVTASAARNIEGRLGVQGINTHVELSAVHPEYLRKLPPYILTFELMTKGVIIWGDHSVLSLIPPFASTDIVLEDAWRLLANRIVEQLDLLATPKPPLDATALFPHYRTVKFFLDMATSLLVFLRAYQPTYRQRAEALRLLVDRLPATQTLPFSIRDFTQIVSACTRFKLQQAARVSLEDQASVPLWEEAVSYARQLWRWELAQLTGCQRDLSDSEAMRRWMRLQPWMKRFRGWAYVLRKCGWHKSWRHWPHWLGRARHASPRYWVYAAASELFFRFPELMRTGQHESRRQSGWRELRSSLPVPGEPDSGSGNQSWKELASQVVWNYREFVRMTRA
jgi:hypothetical protein